MKRPRHKLSSTDGIDYIQKQKSVKVNTERLSDLDRFPFPNGLLVMPVEELKQFQKFGVNFDCTFIDISIMFFIATPQCYSFILRKIPYVSKTVSF